MQTNLKAMRKYDAGLILITLVAVVAFVSVLFNLSPNTSATPRFSQLTYLNVDNGNALDFTTITRTPLTDWTPISSPINLGMNTSVHWFSMVIAPTQSNESRFLLHIDYPLLDSLDEALDQKLAESLIESALENLKQQEELQQFENMKMSMRIQHALNKALKLEGLREIVVEESLEPDEEREGNSVKYSPPLLDNPEEEVPVESGNEHQRRRPSPPKRSSPDGKED